MSASARPSLTPLLFWALLYLMAGMVSRVLDDPDSSVLFVWLPAGVGTAALLLSHRASRLPLVGLLLLSEFVLRVQREDVWTTLLVLTAMSVVAIVATAWVVERLDPKREGLRFVGALLAGALVGSVINAVPDVAWVAYAEQVPFGATVLPWAISYFVGVLVVAPVMLSWAGFQVRRSGGPTRSDLRVGGIAFVLLLVFTHLLFDGDTAQRFPGSVGFGLTWLPMLLAVVVSLVWGPRGGVLAVLVLSLQVLWQTSQGEGPFGSLDTIRGESILEAQMYLAANALLMMLLNTLRSTRQRALEQAAAWRSRFELALAGSSMLMYRYDPQRNSVEWGGDLENAFGIAQRHLATREDFFNLIHPEDRARVEMHWKARMGSHSSDYGAIRFRVAHADGGWRVISDSGAPLRDIDGGITTVAGIWRLGDLEQE